MEINEKLFQDKIVDGTMITGGHFMLLADGKANLNDGTIQSFDIAVRLYAQGRDQGTRLGVGLLINNMGGVCDAKKKVCLVNPDDLKSNFVLPDEYLAILKKYNVKDTELTLYWEKSLRNRGKKELLKVIDKKTDFVELKEGAYWFVNPKDGRLITLSRANMNDKYGIAACPLIMAAMAYQQRQDGFPSSINFYYVDLDNEVNIPNYFAIEKGRIVAETFYEGLDIINVYLLKDKVITSIDMQ